MSLPTNFFIGRGSGGISEIYEWQDFSISYNSQNYTAGQTQDGINSDFDFGGTSTPMYQYSDSTVNSGVVATGSRVYFVVPSTSTFRFVLSGSAGGASAVQYGGQGARMQADFDLTEGQYVGILLGLHMTDTGENDSAGGGGASLMFTTPTWGSYSGMTALMVAGGGGGAAGTTYHHSVPTAIGGSASHNRYGYWNVVPPAGTNYPVQTDPGNGGIGANNTNAFQNPSGTNIATFFEGQSSHNVSSSTYSGSTNWNGAAGGAGLSANGGTGHNGSSGGIRLNGTAQGGTGQGNIGKGGFGGGGGGRNTSGGGGGGYIGGTGGYWSDLSTTLTGQQEYYTGGVGGTSFVASSGYNVVGSSAPQNTSTRVRGSFGTVSIARL